MPNLGTVQGELARWEDRLSAEEAAGERRKRRGEEEGWSR
jgi:hypothetical protein